MKISDSFLKAQLQNVFWIGGGGYGGKTTITDLLASKYAFQAYHPEDLLQEHKKAASAEDHPALMAPFYGWEGYFNRPMAEYIQGIEDGGREQFEMVVLDLVKLNAQSRVVVDGFILDPWRLKSLTEYNKIIFLYADEETIREGFFARLDKQDLVDVINTLSDPVSTREHILRVVCEYSARKRKEADAAGFKVILRDRETNPQETLETVEKHFGLT